MKIRELIETLSKENPDTEVNLMNGVGGYQSLTKDEVGWEDVPLRPPWQGPTKPVYRIYASW
jgi:hypothetical protein